MFKIKRKNVKYHLFFSLIFVLFYTIISFIITNVGYMIYNPTEMSLLKASEPEDVSVELMEQAFRKIVIYDFTILIPLILVSMLAFSTFLIKKYYELDLKSSFKLAIVLVIFFYIFSWLLAIPGGKLFAYIQSNAILKYLY